MAEDGSSLESYVLFELAGATYGIPSRDVRQMEMVEQITPVPNAPAFVEGVVYSRGRVIPAINLRTRFGFERVPHDLRSRLVITQTHNRIVGFIVDTAREFVTIATDAIIDPPEEISGLSGRYLEGIARLGERLVLILNITEVLSGGESEQLPEDGARLVDEEAVREREEEAGDAPLPQDA